VGYVDSKHMDQMIEGGQIPTEATAALWITDRGLESSRAALSFEELLRMLLKMASFAEALATPDVRGT
jgi:hypothetical protein